MKIFNEANLLNGSAKILIITTYIESLSKLTPYTSKLKNAGILPSEVAYVGLYDSKVDSVGVVELRTKMQELGELLKVSGVNIIVDETGYRDAKGKYNKYLIFEKLFNKDTSMWDKRGVHLARTGEVNVKWICGFRGATCFREKAKLSIIDSEFTVQNLNDIEIREVTDLAGLKELNKFLQDTDEVLFDIETSALKFDTHNSKILCLQFGKRSEPYISYVVWYEKTGVNVTEDYKKYVRQLTERIVYSKTMVAHNGSSFDIPFICFQFGLDPLKISVTDTLVLTYIARNSTRKSPMDLKTLVFSIMSDYDNELDTFKEEYCKEHKLKKEEFTYDYIPRDILVKYSAWDITALAYLVPQLEEECRNHLGGDLYERVWLGFYKDYCPALSKMSLAGVPFNLEKAKEWKVKKEAELKELTLNLESDPKIAETEVRLNEANYKKALAAYDKKCEEAVLKGKEFKGKKPLFEDGKYGSINFDVKFNPASAEHKRKLFFETLGLKPLKDTATGATSVDSDTATKLAKANPDIEVLGLFEGIAKFEKELKSFYEPYIEMAENTVDGRIRGSYRINGTLTGRLSQTSPNTLQIPSKSDFKYLISNKDDSDYYIIGCDIGSLESNIATILSGDKAMYQIRDFAESDAHSYLGIALRNKGISKFMACKEDYLDNTNIEHIKFFKANYPKLRAYAKTANFACLFGIGGAAIAADLGIDYKDGCDIVLGFWETHYGLREYFDKQQQQAIEKGFVQTEDLGLCLLTPDANSDDGGIASASHRTSNNFGIQSYSFITHKANVWLCKKFAEEGLDAKVITEIHDCVYVEAHKKDLARATVLCEIAMTLPFRDEQPFLLESPAEIGRTMKGGYEIKGESEEDKIAKVEEWLKQQQEK